MDDPVLQPALELVDAARAGDPLALDTLLRTAWPHAFRISLMIVKDRSLAEDAAQEASIAAGLGIQGLREGRAFAQWFLRIAVREAMRVTKRRSPGFASLADVHLVEAAASTDILDLRSSIAALPIALRVPLVLAAYCGLSSKEIGAVLDIRAGAVRFRIWRAKTILREQLAPRVDIEPNRSFAV
ncbi:MAG TPA: sigma factor-like helix-turn-helix DNA-binding protein [Candidatus Elarobacter sp.]|jgi:RNA polymerase sigma-70 factor (ECF subfamily)